MSPLALGPGTRLGVYDITAPIGEGGMGQVYRATDTTLRSVIFSTPSPGNIGNDLWVARMGSPAGDTPVPYIVAANVLDWDSRVALRRASAAGYTSDSHCWQVAPDDKRFLLLLNAGKEKAGAQRR